MIDQFIKTGIEIKIYVGDKKISINRSEFENWWENTEEDIENVVWNDFWDGEHEDIHGALEAFLIFKYGDEIFDEILRGNELLSDFED